MPEKITENIQAIQDYKFFHKLASQPFVKEIWLFGSRARGDNQDRADIDLAISCPLATFQNWMAIQEIIENADTLLKIDCIRLDELDENSALKQSVLTQGIKLYNQFTIEWL